MEDRGLCHARPDPRPDPLPAHPSCTGGAAQRTASDGGRAGSESVRLKLESPLFVADALLSAAEQQLAAELAVARQDAASVALVRSQMAAFRREMEKEGQLQVGGGVGCRVDRG